MPGKNFHTKRLLVNYIGEIDIRFVIRNTLAYFDASIRDEDKSFVTLGYVANCIKLWGINLLTLL